MAHRIANAALSHKSVSSAHSCPKIDVGVFESQSGKRSRVEVDSTNMLLVGVFAESILSFDRVGVHVWTEKGVDADALLGCAN